VSLPLSSLPAMAQGVLIIPATEPFQTYIPEDKNTEHSENMGASEMEHASRRQHAQGENSMNMGANINKAPVSEPGQSAFAAIAEIVAKLSANPDTDWNKVSIATLREHLRDMDVVTINSTATTNSIEGGLEFVVTGAQNVSPSIQRMVLAHADIMQGIEGWNYTAETLPDGARLRVIVPEEDLPKLTALGFYGLMASGMHHQAHHWAMATGENPHN
ncbi:MAG: hypothetical protein L3J13_07005, partial [Devosiaceae bacterium]|nr:hypothetical protein [Devosiaceae bacterium]